MQAYDVRVAVDDLQLTVGHAVTQNTKDNTKLTPIITAMAQAVGEHTPNCSRTPATAGKNLGNPRDHDRRLHLDTDGETR